jgi:natural product precursor
MKIRSNVKAGGSSYQHNEKLTNDNSSSIEQKKTIGKKLRLSKETIRELKDSDLKRIAGGRYYTASCNVTCR